MSSLAVGRIQIKHFDASGILAQAQIVQKDCQKYNGMVGWTIRPTAGQDILRLDLTIKNLFGEIGFLSQFQSTSIINAITILTDSRFMLLGKGIRAEASPSM